MIDAGMHIGSHGHNHLHLDLEAVATQDSDINQSFAMLELLSTGSEGFSFCYPYGGHNEDTVDLLRKYKCAFALTTETGLSSDHVDNPLTIPRLDTNCLPKIVGSTPPDWTRQVLNI